MTTLPTFVLLAISAAAAGTATSTVSTVSTASTATVAASTAAITTPSLLAEFKRIDTNEDGRVSSSEHEVYARKLFDEMDVDVDYKLSMAEITAAGPKFFRHVSAGVGGILGGIALSTAEIIERLDANHDGSISRDEHANAARAKYQAMDTNNNGELSVEEFAAGG